MTTANNTTLLRVAIIMVAAITTGCASGPDRVERDFGNSVRAMNRAQTQDLTKVLAPDTDAIETTDGQRMENALQSYRENVAAPGTVQQPIQISIGE
jgi:type IV pilus biogenesis protein CpaD/CtpE